MFSFKKKERFAVQNKVSVSKTSDTEKAYEVSDAERD